MTQTTAAPDAKEQHAPQTPHIIPRPHTDAAALRAITRAKEDMRERAEHIRSNPEEHKPKLVLSEHVRGTSILDKIADGVNRVCGSMWVLKGQDQVLAILNRFASKDMPGKQSEIQDCVNKILAAVHPSQA
jgi:hypothetical protein